MRWESRATRTIRFAVTLLATGIVDFCVAQDSISDVAITVLAPADFIRVGRLSYLITVTNSGVDAAMGVVVSNTFSPGALFVTILPSRGTVAALSNSFMWNVGTLNPHNFATNYFVADLNTAGFVTNAASVTITNNDPNTANNSATVVVRVVTNVFSPVLAHSRFSDGSLSSSFHTEMGMTYEVQYSHTPGVPFRWFPGGCDFCIPPDLPPLPSEPWFTLTNIVGDGSLKSFSDSSPASDHRFYRLLLH